MKKQDDDQTSRVDHSQYAAPLATASENEAIHAIFERDDVVEAMAGHCCRTHLDSAAVQRCSYCASLMAVLSPAIRALIDAVAAEGRPVPPGHTEYRG